MYSRRAWLNGFVGLLLSLTLLAACTNNKRDTVPAAGPIQFASLEFRLGNVEIVNEISPPPPEDGTVKGLSVSPQAAFLDWAGTHLLASGALPGFVRFRATEASAQRVTLDKTPGVRGWFTRDQEERVAVVLSGVVEARADDGRLIASSHARTEAFRTFAEKTSAADRQRGLDLLMKGALHSFGRQLERQVRAEMPDLLRE